MKSLAFTISLTAAAIWPIAAKPQEFIMRGLFIQSLTGVEREAQLKSFNKSTIKAKASGKVKDCGDIWQVPVGVANGNNSYGAICNIESSQGDYRAFICNDVMIGRFKIIKDFIDSPEWIANSVFENCYGG